MAPQRRGRACVLLALLFLLPSLLSVPLSIAQTSEATVLARSDADLRSIAAQRGWPGAGTSASPIIIAGFSTSIDRTAGIELRDTQLHVHIEDAHVTSTSGRADAIRLVNVRNVTLERANVEGVRTGIHVEKSAAVTLNNNVVRSGENGILLLSTTGATLQGNQLALNERGVQLRTSTHNTFHDNRITMASNGLGITFDSEASYDNAIPGTNTVNGEALHWHVRLSGTPESPARIDGPRVHVPGMTNVAQIACHACSHVVIEDASARHGNAAGILVSRGDNVTLIRASAEGNGAAGIHIVATRAASATDATATANRVGILVEESPLTTLERAHVERNLQEGVKILGGRGHIVTSLESSKNARGLHLENVVDARVSNGTLRDQTNAALQLTGVSASRFESLAVLNSTPGIRLTSSAGNAFFDNHITLRERQYGFFFADETSYRNEIATSNLVEDEPVWWLAGQAGTPGEPLVVRDVEASTPSATNVGQLVLYGASHLRLENATARDGRSAGIVVLASHNVTLTGAQASGNAAGGIVIERSQNVTLDAPTTRENRNGGITVRGSNDVTIAGAASTTDVLHGVSIEASRRAHLVNVLVDRSTGAGITLQGSSYVTLQDSRVNGTRSEGILVTTSHDNILSNVSVLRSVGDGIIIQSSSARNLLERALVEDGARRAIVVAGAGPGNIISKNDIGPHSAGFHLEGASGTVFTANNVSTLPSQVGFFFADERSYDVTLTPDNLVAGNAVYWYNGLRGSEASPARISGLRIEANGVTNVAQLVVTAGSNVLIEDIAVANGTRGILIHASSSVTVRDVQASHAETGIILKNTLTSHVVDLTSSNNTIAVRLEGTSNSTIQRLSAAGSQTAVSLDGRSRGNQILATNASGVTKSVVTDATVKGNPPRGDNLVVDAGRDKFLSPGGNATFSDTLLLLPAGPETPNIQRWDFGDGTFEESTNAAPFRPIHVYEQEGYFTARYTVTTTGGRTYTDEVQVIVLEPPRAPRAFVGEGGDAHVRLTWARPTNVDDELAYNVYRGPNPNRLTFLTRVDETIYIDEGLRNGGRYHYAVSAVRGPVEGSRSNTINVTANPPPEPVVEEPAAKKRFFGIPGPSLPATLAAVGAGLAASRIRKRQ